MTEKNHHWSQQKRAPDCPEIECAPYHPYDDYRADPSGMYVLIRVNFEFYRIEAAVCDKRHTIQAVFHGRSAQDLYHGILGYEERKGLNWFQRKDHLTYLGKELKKAEIALAAGQNSYYQE